MKRRTMLGGTVGALAAGVAGCKYFSGSSGSKRSALGNTAKLSLRFAGLCAFVANAGNGFYDVGLIDPTKVKDPGNEAFHEHKPSILIDSNVVSGGTTITGADLAALRLPTDLTSFQMWPLKGYNVEIGGLPTNRPTNASLTGAFPLRSVYDSGTVISQWWNEAFVQSYLTVKAGQLTSVAPRVTGKGAEKCRWKLTGAAAPDEQTWKKIPDLPRLMSDLVEYRTRVPDNAQIKLILRSDTTNVTTIPTTATGELEVWIINEPKKNDHTTYEMNNPWELQHVRAFYQLFTSPPGTLAVPIANQATYPTSDPIFCPPAEA